MLKRSALVLAVAMLAGCQPPVDPAKIKFHFGAQKVIPQDRICILPIATPFTAEPGEKITFNFDLSNTVRDEVFIQMDESTAYVASMLLYMPGEDQPRMLPMNAPTVNPAASASSYKRLLKPTGTASEETLKISLPVELPKFEWEKIEISIIFSLRGYTRESRGEFSDTITKTFTLTRKYPQTKPATRP